MGSLFDACRPFAVAGIISDEIRCPREVCFNADSDKKADIVRLPRRATGGPPTVGEQTAILGSCIAGVRSGCDGSMLPSPSGRFLRPQVAT
jgi:hypothetical protein